LANMLSGPQKYDLYLRWIVKYAVNILNLHIVGELKEDTRREAFPVSQEKKIQIVNVQFKRHEECVGSYGEHF
jgi:hypothetical protein